MPIKGLAEETLRPGEGFPRIAKLRKGAERTAEDIKKNRPGKDLPYFRITFEPQFEELEAVWRDLYGDEPDSFDQVYIVGDTPDEAFDYWKEEWAAGGLIHRCDGEAQVLSYDKRTSQYVRAKLPCAAPACACKPIGRLNLFFLEFAEITGVLGYILAETHSLHDIIHVKTVLRRTQQMCGTLTGIPFRFGRTTETISTPRVDRKTGDKYRAQTEKSLFFLHINQDYTREMFLPALRAAAVLPNFGRTEAPALPATTTPVIDTQHASDLLGQRGANGGSRRLVGPEPTETDDRQPAEDIVEGTVDETWTPDALIPRIDGLFDHRAHTVKAIQKYSDPDKDAYILRPEMTLDQAEAAIRLYRSAEGKAGKGVFEDEQARERFIGACMDIVPDDASIIAALDAVANYPLPGLRAWRGDKSTAWAAVLAYAGKYDPAQIPLPADASAVLRALVAYVCDYAKASTPEDEARADEEHRRQQDAEFESI